MSLIKCDECGRMISDKSQFCPQCGYPTSSQSAMQPAGDADNGADEELRERDNRHKVWAYIAVVLAVTAIIGICYFAGAPDADDATADEAAAPDATEAVAADSLATDTSATAVEAPAAAAPVAAPKPAEAAPAPAPAKPAAAPKAETAPEPPLPVDDKPLEPAPAPAHTPAPAPAPAPAQTTE